MPQDEFDEPQALEEFALLTLFSLETRLQVAQKVYEQEAISSIESNCKCIVVVCSLFLYRSSDPAREFSTEPQLYGLGHHPPVYSSAFSS